MINNLTFFDSVDDIKKLTGLDEDQLWNQGFNLDDMDCGFRIKNEGYFKVESYNDYDYKRWKWVNDVDCNYYNNDDFPYSVHRILTDWEDYCVGYYLAYYDNYVYVTLHHA